MIARPLAGHILATSDPSFAIVEWSDSGASTRGRPVASLHSHRTEDEAWIVLEGRLGIVVGEAELEAGPGDAVLAPRGTPHTYWKAGSELLRYVLVMGPRTAALVDALHRPGSTEDVAALLHDHDSDLLT